MPVPPARMKFPELPPADDQEKFVGFMLSKAYDVLSEGRPPAAAAGPLDCQAVPAAGRPPLARRSPLAHRTTSRRWPAWRA